MATIKGTFDGDYTFTATAATKKTGQLSISILGPSFNRLPYTISDELNSSLTAVVTAKSGTKSYTYDFKTSSWKEDNTTPLSAEYGETITIATSTKSPFDSAYNKTATATSLSAVVDDTFTTQFDITGDNYSLKQYQVNITQSANQTITVSNTSTDGTNQHTSGFTAYYGDSWSASVSANEGYNPGTIATPSGIVTGEVTISASAAEQQIKDITSDIEANFMAFSIDRKPYIADGVGKLGNTVELSVTNITKNDGITATYYYDIDTRDFVRNNNQAIMGSVGDVIRVYMTATGKFSNAYTHYIQEGGYYELQLTENGMVGYGMNGIGNSATLKKYTFTITQSDNQTINVANTTLPTLNGDAVTNTYTTSFTAYWGDSWTASISASEGYNAGTLSQESGTITEAVALTATAATLNAFTVTIKPTTNQTIKVAFSNGHEYSSNTTSDVVCTEPPGTTFTVSVEPADGYIAGAAHVEEAAAASEASYLAN